jgi:hypothetical protein
MKIAIFWDMNTCFVENYFLPLQFSLKVEEERSSGMSVAVYQATWSHITENSNTSVLIIQLRWMPTGIQVDFLQLLSVILRAEKSVQ